MTVTTSDLHALTVLYCTRHGNQAPCRWCDPDGHAENARQEAAMGTFPSSKTVQLPAPGSRP